jgi:Kef-type K+ transport system membrane component KefB
MIYSYAYYIIFIIVAIAASWLLRFLLRRRDRVRPNSREELLSVLGLCLATSYLMAGAVYVILHVAMLWLSPDHTIIW